MTAAASEIYRAPQADQPTVRLRLRPADLVLIAEAREAFGRDFRYLEQILWSARNRRPSLMSVPADAREGWQSPADEC